MTDHRGAPRTSLLHPASLLQPVPAAAVRVPAGYVASAATAPLVDDAAAVIGASFHDLDSCLWLVPDPEERREVLPAYLRMLTEHALTYGHLDVITHTPPARDINGRGQGGEEPGGRLGGGGRLAPGEPATGTGSVTTSEVETEEVVAAAVWLRAPFPAVPDYEQRLDDICGRWARRFRVLDAAMQAAHPPAAVHAYLVYLGATPAHQGRGLGSLLLAQHLEQVDAAGQGAYLEASNSRSAALYARHGFVFLGDPIQLPDDVEPIFPMWRPAAPAMAEAAIGVRPADRAATQVHAAGSGAAGRETASR